MSGPRLKSTFGRLMGPLGQLMREGRPAGSFLAPSSRPTLDPSSSSSSLSSFLPFFPSSAAPFSTTTPFRDWLIPREMSNKRSPKGRPRVSTGGSMRGTTVVWGDYGLRMVDHHRRITSNHLRMAMDTLKQRFRGMEYQLYTRVAANISVAVSGNEVRMGKGKGTHDHWVARVAVSQIVLEIKTNVHEQVVRDAFKVVGSKLPGKYELARKGDPPYMGITPLNKENTIEGLMKPKRKVVEQISPFPMVDPSSAHQSNSAAAL